MSHPTMRAKFKVFAVIPNGNAEVLHFGAVYKEGSYPADGTDEDNTFAKFTPTAALQMQVNNPDLLGKFKPGDKFYVDFTPVAGT